MSDLDSYGGNPVVIASQNEIHRIAGEIYLIAQLMRVPLDFASWLQNPLRSLRIQLDIHQILERLDSLHLSCIVASEGYFTAEAQISRRLEINFIPQLAQLGVKLASYLGWSFSADVSTSVSRTETNQNPPNNVSEMFTRLRALSLLNSPTVGVDGYHFENSTSRVFVVTIPGTQEMSLGMSDNPLDMSSNIQAMAGSGNAHSEQVVIKAMQAAGIGKDDQVVFVGHSQGAMVAANIAGQENDFLVAGLIAFGGPIAQATISKKIPVLAIEHSNDPVPNLSGKANPMKENWVTVQRRAKPNEADGVFYSHDLNSYQTTSVLIDVSKETGIEAIRRKIAEVFRHTTVGTQTDYRIKRVG